MLEVTQERTIWLCHDLLNSRGEVAMHRLMRPSRRIEYKKHQSNSVLILKRQLTSFGSHTSFHISIDPLWDIPDSVKRVNVVAEVAPLHAIPQVWPVYKWYALNNHA